MGYHICRDKKHQMPRGRTLPDQNAGRMKAPKQKYLGVFEKQQEGPVDVWPQLASVHLKRMLK